MSRRNAHRLPAARLTLLGALVALSGCSADYWVRFQYVTDAPAAVVIESDHIQIPAGLAAAVRAYPMRDERELGDEITVHLQSQRPNLLGVDASLELDQFVIYGVEPGTTAVDLYFDDNFIGQIPATVVEP